MTDTTPTREEMLKKIYEVIADKTEKIIMKFEIYCPKCGSKTDNFWYNVEKKQYFSACKECDYKTYEKTRETKRIIQHKVMIGDILQRMFENVSEIRDGEKRRLCVREYDILLINRKDKRKPIDDQSDDCVGFIHSLLPNEQR